MRSPASPPCPAGPSGPSSGCSARRRRARSGRPTPLPPVENALRFLAGRSEAPPGRRLVVGAPAVVRAGLEAVAAEYGADEVMVVTITYDHEMRRRSYELI